MAKYFLIYLFSLLFPNIGCILASDIPLDVEFFTKSSSGIMTDKFSIGQNVGIEIKIKNTSNKPITLHKTGPGFDILVEKNGRIIWSNNFAQVFTQVITEMHLKPGESISFTTKWTGHDNSQNKVLVGQYHVIPKLLLYFDKRAIPPPNGLTISLVN